MLLRMIDALGTKTLDSCSYVGKVGVFASDVFATFFRTKLKTEKVFYHMNYIGVGTLGIVVLVGITIGAVIALQSYIGLERFGATQFIGPIVFLSMVREFGPVFSAIMVIGRAGSAITAEIGTMRITEQIDALQTLCIDTHQYLIVPRIVATTVMMPFLSLFCSFLGIIAGYVMSVHVLNINAEIYMESTISNVEVSDITNGIIKAVFFGLILSIISTYKGFTASGGARGVGIAITQSVVYSILTIVIADYILISLMFSR
ncbi:ABC transporter permease [Candidatus Dependentiae bacterium]|nr:ABC transporter permease [Candidatus Dependentiae bacterium]